MVEIRKRAFVGIVGLVSAGLFSVGCGSSSNSTGTAGSTGSAGSTAGTSGAGTAGTTGSGGSGNVTGTGTGGAGNTVGCSASDAPASATIADFASPDAMGLEIMGGIVTYGGGVTPITYSTTDGDLHMMDTVQVGSAPQYIGLVIYFNAGATGTDCTDASAYTGVQFDIGGSLMGPGCTLQYSTNDSEHSDSVKRSTTDATMPNDPKASGPTGAYSPQLQIPSLMSTPLVTKMVAFNDPTLGAGLPAPPPAGVDPMKIEGIQWQLTVPAATDGGTTQCVLDLTIDNVKFYQ